MTDDLNTPAVETTPEPPQPQTVDQALATLIRERRTDLLNVGQQQAPQPNPFALRLQQIDEQLADSDELTPQDVARLTAEAAGLVTQMRMEEYAHQTARMTRPGLEKQIEDRAKEYGGDAITPAAMTYIRNVIAESGDQDIANALSNPTQIQRLVNEALGHVARTKKPAAVPSGTTQTSASPGSAPSGDAIPQHLEGEWGSYRAQMEKVADARASRDGGTFDREKFLAEKKKQFIESAPRR